MPGMATKPVQLRLDPALLAAIDERASRAGLSRNEWCARTLQRIVDTPPQVFQRTERL